jgi:hypothetical protein
MQNIPKEIQDADWFQGLYLFKELIKLRCEWQGDIMSKRWSECLFITDDRDIPAVEEYLALYREGVDYKRDGNQILIA